VRSGAVGGLLAAGGLRRTNHTATTTGQPHWCDCMAIKTTAALMIVKARDLPKQVQDKDRKIVFPLPLLNVRALCVIENAGKWRTKAGRNGCHGRQNSLGGALLSSLAAVEAHCDSLPRCVFFIWNERGLDPKQGKAGDAFFCSVDFFGDPTSSDPGWLVGGRVS
jgi:hypothetical protein